MPKRKTVVEFSEARFPKKHKVCFKSTTKRGPTVQKTKCVSFGDRRYKDYTQHKDPKRKAAYLKRHRKRENWRDKKTAGFWAKHLLWNKPSLKASMKDVEKRMRLKVVTKR